MANSLEKRLGDLEAVARSSGQAIDEAATLASLERKLTEMGISTTVEEAAERGYQSRADEFAAYVGVPLAELKGWLKERALQ